MLAGAGGGDVKASTAEALRRVANLIQQPPDCEYDVRTLLLGVAVELEFEHDDRALLAQMAATIYQYGAVSETAAVHKARAILAEIDKEQK